MMKKIFISGAHSGIGRHLTNEFLKKDYHVISADINRIISNSSQHTTYQLDLTKEKEVDQMFNDIKTIDYAVNCAGVSAHRDSLHHINLNTFLDEIKPNISMFFNCLKNEICIMRNQNKGKIINISSISAHRGMKNMACYSSSKAVISNLTKVSAIENYDYNIHINSISPATIDTPFIRRKNKGIRDYSDIFYTKDVGKTADIFSAVQFFITQNFMTGHDLTIDGGLTDLLVI